MSLQFNDTTNELGLCQEMDTICNSNSTNHPLKVKARRINYALDSYLAIALGVDNTWQIDDKNFTDLPISTFNLVSGQRDYKITVDEDSNEILKVHKVYIKKSSTGDFVEIDYTDESNTDSADLLLNNTSQAGGVPNKYNWFGNSIFFDPVPNYDSTGGVKIIYQRTSSYMVSTDTTKVPGIPGIHHMYLARKASLPFLVDKSLDNRYDVEKQILKDEEEIREYLYLRSRDGKNQSIKMADISFM